MVLIGRVAHDLMDARGVEVAQQAANDMGVMQTGIAGKVVAHGRGLDRDIGCIDANRPHVGNGCPVGKGAAADTVVQAVIAFMHQGARRP